MAEKAGGEEGGLGMRVSEVLAAELRGVVNIQTDDCGYAIAVGFPSYA
jgi:hypothetical protein